MKVVYIAGPYRASSEWGVSENIHRASVVARKYWQLGYAVICPHTNSAFMGGIDNDSCFLNGDIEILRRCDIIVMLPGWIKSHGAVKEHEFAMHNDIEVIYEV